MSATAGTETTRRDWQSRLAAAADVMRDLSRATGPDELFRLFDRRVAALFPVSRLLVLSRRDLDPPRVRVTWFNLWPGRVTPYRAADRLPVISGGLLASLCGADDPVVLDDLRLAPDDPATDLLGGQRSLLALPLYEAGVAAGTVVCTREGPHGFSRDQLPDLIWVANLFHRATEALAAGERLAEAFEASEYELRAVADLQANLLPATPRVAGLETAVHYRPARHASGDYYDFFPLPDGRLGVLVADVSGHGAPAAVLMAVTHSLAHSLPEPPANPGRFLAHLNAHLGRQYTRASGSFVTAFYGVFDPAADTLTYAAAGHPPPRYGPSGGGWRSLTGPNRLPLGVNAKHAGYPEEVVRFGPGDRLVLFTDGVMDAANPAGRTFGPAGIDAALAAGPIEPAGLVAGLVAALDAFGAGQPPADDRTLVVVRRE